MTEDKWVSTGAGIWPKEGISKSPIGPLAELYNFRFGFTLVGLPEILGCSREHTVAGVHHEFEYATFYTSEFPKLIGQLDHGGKAAKKARTSALMSLRIKMWSNWSVKDKAGNPTYEGTVRFFNPVTKELQKQSVLEAARWTRDFLKPLRQQWRGNREAAGDPLDDVYNSYSKTSRAEEEFMTHAQRVWYLLHFVKTGPAIVSEVAFNEENMITAKAMATDLAGQDLADFNLRHLRALYS